MGICSLMAVTWIIALWGLKTLQNSRFCPKFERNCQNFRLRRPKLRFSERTQILRSLPEGGGSNLSVESLRFDPPPLHFSDPYQGGGQTYGVGAPRHLTCSEAYFWARRRREKNWLFSTVFEGKINILQGKIAIFSRLRRAKNTFLHCK